MSEPKRIPIVISETGELGTVPETELQDNLQRGAVRLATPKEIHDATIQKKYGDREIRTALEAGADELTLGLYSKAAQKLGLETEEEQKGQREANPTATTVGKMGGFAAGLMLPGGVGKVVGALPKGISAAGNAVKAAVQGSGTSLARKAMASGLGAATEGALIGAAQAVEEDILGDAELTAEKLAASVGFGALTGGAIGAAAPVLGAGASKLGSTAKDAAKRLLGGLAGRPLEATAAKEAAIALKPKKGFFAHTDKQLEDIYKQASKDNILANGATAKGIQSRSEELLSDYGPRLGKVHDLLDAAPINKVHVDDMMAAVNKDLVAPLEGRSEFSAELSKKVYKKILTPLEASAGPDGTYSYKQLQIIKEDLGTQAKFANPNPTPIQEMYRDAYRVVKKLQEDAAEAASKTLGKDFASEYAAAKKGYEAAKTYGELATNFIEKQRQSGNAVGLMDMVSGASGAGIGGAVFGAPGALIGGVGSYAAKRFAPEIRLGAASAIDKLSRIGAVEAASNAVDMNIARTLARTIGKAAVTAGNAGRLGLAQGAALASSDPFTKESEKVRALAADTPKLINHFNQVTSQLAEAAPATTANLAAVTARATQFLASKLPPEQVGPRGLVKPPMSKIEKAKFMRYQRAVEKPMTLMEEVQAGKVNPETVEAVRTVYPKIYDFVQRVSAMLIADQPQSKLNRKKLNSLSFALSTPLTPAMSKNFLGGAQGYVGGQQQQGQGGGRSRRGTEGQSQRLMSSSMTTSQRLSARGSK